MDKLQARELMRAQRRKKTLAAAAASSAVSSESKNMSILRLMTLLSNSDPVVRQRAIGTLGKIRGWDAVTAIIRCLKDPIDTVRITACQTLGQMRAHDAKKSLYDLINDEDQQIQCCAAESLALMGDKYGLPRIKKLVIKKGDHQLNALRCLNQLTGRQFRLNDQGLKEAIRWLKPPKRSFFSIH